MTETEWLNCSDPTPMLKFLHGRGSDRKSKLLIVGLCRLNWELHYDHKRREMVDLAERYVDGLVSEEDLEMNKPVNPPMQELWSAVKDLATRSFVNNNPGNYSLARSYLSPFNAPIPALLRCIYGMHPFRTITLDPLWLIWNDHTVQKLAEAIYEQKAFNRLLILADALEEAGCEDLDILEHCRSEEPHVRGCWVVDLLLGKS